MIKNFLVIFFLFAAHLCVTQTFSAQMQQLALQMANNGDTSQTSRTIKFLK